MLFNSLFGALCSAHAVFAFTPTFSPHFSSDKREQIARQAVRDAFLLAWSAQNFPDAGVFASYFPATFPIATANALFARIVDPALAAGAITGRVLMTSLTVEEADHDDPTDSCNIAPKPLAHTTQTGAHGADAKIHLCKDFFKFPAITGVATDTVPSTYGKMLRDRELLGPHGYLSRPVQISVPFANVILQQHILARL